MLSETVLAVKLCRTKVEEPKILYSPALQMHPRCAVVLSDYCLT